MKTKLTVLFFLFISHLFYSQTFSGTTGTVSDDGQPNDFTANVSGLAVNQLSSSLGLVQVCLDITHTYDSDLNVFLMAPDGTTINLFSGIGGDQDNFTNTCLSQSAGNSINTASAPFTGIFKPQETLGNCNNGQNGNGNWTLRIVDTYAQDEGVINHWSITFGENAATPFVFSSSNLPIVIINTGGVPIADEPPIPATMGIIDNGPGNINYVTDAPNNYNGPIAIEYRGAYSQSLPQKPFKIETLDVNDLELNVSLLGMPEEHDWNLIANYNDKVFMRNNLAYQLFTDMGHYAARNRYCEVVVNGIYQGIYLLMESLKRDHNRIDIAKLETTENSGLDLTGGYILKNDYWDDSNSWLTQFHPIDHPELEVHLVYDYPKPDNITLEQKTYIQDFINDFETVLYSPNFADPVNGYAKYIDTDSFIDYLILNELTRNNDGFKKSSYFHKDKDSATEIAKLKAGPVWDFDWAWKNINECPILSVTDGSGWAHQINDCQPDVNSPGWYIRLLQDSHFRDLFRCRWENLRTTILSLPALNAAIDSRANYLDQAQARHFEKWGNLGVNTGAPELDSDPTTFAGQITKFKNWIAVRIAWLDNNIPGNPDSCNLSTNFPSHRDFEIYPNPAQDQLHLINKTTTSFTIEIFDVSGKLVLKTAGHAAHQTLNVSQLDSGVYFCKVSHDNKNSTVLKLAILH